jgi:hypothetical protein
MVKVRDLIEGNKDIPLPVIMDCIEVFNYEISDKQTFFKNQQVRSEFYQTSKLSCITLRKPLHIKNEKPSV